MTEKVCASMWLLARKSHTRPARFSTNNGALWKGKGAMSWDFLTKVLHLAIFINKRLTWMLQRGKAAIKSDFICKGWIIDSKEKWLGMTWGWFKRGIWCFFNRAHARALALPGRAIAHCLVLYSLQPFGRCFSPRGKCCVCCCYHHMKT